MKNGKANSLGSNPAPTPGVMHPQARHCTALKVRMVLTSKDVGKVRERISERHVLSLSTVPDTSMHSVNTAFLARFVTSLALLHRPLEPPFGTNKCKQGSSSLYSVLQKNSRL